MQPDKAFANNNINHRHYHHKGDNYMDFEAAFELQDKERGFLSPGTIAYDMAQVMHTAYLTGKPIPLSMLLSLWCNHPKRQTARTMTNAYKKVLPGESVSSSYVARVNDVLDTWCKANDFPFPERLVESGLYELRWTAV